MDMEQDKDYELADLRRWLADNSVCMQGSLYPGQIASGVAKYLYYVNSTSDQTLGGHTFSEKDLWINFYNLNAMEIWIKSRGRNPATLYNACSQLKRASIFLSVTYQIKTPEHFKDFITDKMALFRRKRRLSSVLLIERQELKGFAILDDFTVALSSRAILTRFTRIAERSAQVLGSSSAKLTAAEFLFAMRVTMCYVILSMGLRPSSVYTLEESQVHTATSHWSSSPWDRPLILRNPSHKTAASVGSCRLVLSGKGKRIFSVYFDMIRPAALKSFQISNLRQVFFNSNGTRLCSNSLNRNLSALQQQLKVTKIVTCTEIRKSLTSKIRSSSREDELSKKVAQAFCHSKATSDKHYHLGTRDDNAIDIHKRIIRYLAL